MSYDDLERRSDREEARRTHRLSVFDELLWVLDQITADAEKVANPSSRMFMYEEAKAIVKKARQQ